MAEASGHVPAASSPSLHQKICFFLSFFLSFFKDKDPLVIILIVF